MLDDLNEDFNPFSKQTSEIILILLTKEATDTVKNEVAKIMAKLI